MSFRTFLCWFWMMVGGVAMAQSKMVIVDSIMVSGNKRTHESIVLREMNIAKGDTIPFEKLDEYLQRNSELLLNTGLFNSAKLNVKNWGDNNQLDLSVELEETWYIFPLPILELADRNFNVWWSEQNRALNRINLGAHFYHTNFTGRRDYFKVLAQFGYTRKYEIKYRYPYLNKAKTLGFEAVVNFKQQRELQYNTINNKQQFYKDPDKFLYERAAAAVGLLHRPKIRTEHFYIASYLQNRVDDYVISDLNPNFFKQGTSLQRYFSLEYRFKYDTRDLRPYPTDGRYFTFEAVKNGLGIFDDLNNLSATVSYSHYFPLSEKWSTGHNLRVRGALIRKPQPFFNSQALGFGSSFVRGYEFYVIDGIDFFLSRNTVNYRLLNKNFNLGKYMLIKQFRKMPFRLYLTGFGDVGYANNPAFRSSNPISNRPLLGYGVGLNMVLYVDKVFIMEYSFNGENESGFFIRTQMGF